MADCIDLVRGSDDMFGATFHVDFMCRFERFRKLLIFMALPTGFEPVY